MRGRSTSTVPRSREVRPSVPLTNRRPGTKVKVHPVGGAMDDEVRAVPDGPPPAADDDTGDEVEGYMLDGVFIPKIVRPIVNPGPGGGGGSGPATPTPTDPGGGGFHPAPKGGGSKSPINPQ